MKRVFFTESQIREIRRKLDEGFMDGTEATVPDVENGVTTDPPITSFEKDKKHDLPVTTQRRSKRGLFGGFGAKVPNVYPIPNMSESQEYDNTKDHGMVGQSGRELASVTDTSDDSSKSNFVRGLQSKKDGNTMAANMMRLKRENDKGENGDPLYKKALKSAINQQKNTNAGTHAGKPSNTTTTAPSSGNQNGPQPYDEKKNIYYF